MESGVQPAVVAAAAPAPRIIPYGGLIEGGAGLAAGLLAILGITGTLREELAAIATIVIGVALISLGAAVIARYAALTGGEATDLEGGVGIEVIGGAVAIILGILALADVTPWILLAIAIIVLGASLLMGTSVVGRLERVETTTGAQRRAVNEAVLATGTAQALVGITGIVLGILALIGIQIEILVLVALLTFAGAILLGSVAVMGKLARLIRG